MVSSSPSFLKLIKLILLSNVSNKKCCTQLTLCQVPMMAFQVYAVYVRICTYDGYDTFCCTCLRMY